MKKFELWHGDCLELMKNIPDGSVDLVLTDPPYGTMKGIDDKHDWDVVLPTEKVFCELSRIVRPNGRVLLFCQEPYTTEIMVKRPNSFTFCQKLVWSKKTSGVSKMAKTAMVSTYEEICVFKKLYDETHINPLREYAKVVAKFIRYNRKETSEKIGSRGASYFLECDKNQKKWFLCTEEIYQKLIECFSIDREPWFLQYDELAKLNKKYTATFNLWQGGKSKSNVLEYKKDNDGYHPTQKPVALLEDLIQTYSNEGNTVLDFTAGSMSTVIACINTNRNCIAIEKDEHYFSVGCKRVHNHILDNNIDEGYFNIAKKRIEEAVNDLP